MMAVFVRYVGCGFGKNPRESETTYTKSGPHSLKWIRKITKEGIIPW